MTAPDGGSASSSRGAFLETKETVYHLISCLEGLVPRITGRRERIEIFELLGRLEGMVVEMIVSEEFDEELWGPVEGGNGNGGPRPDMPS